MARITGSKDMRPVDMYVGARIRLRRNMLHISQTRMAERIGVTFQQVQKYERGMNRIGSSRLLQICDVLQVTPAWLFEGAPGPKAKSTAAARQVDAALAAFQTDNLAPPLMTVWTRLPVEMKRSMIALMTALADARTENK